MADPVSEKESRRGGIPRGLKMTGPVILSYGFRPFFLGGAVWAVVAMVLWIGVLVFGVPVGGDYGAAAWHMHEMLFGFASAVLAGFLFTAVPNWTGRLPVSGAPLAGVAALWVAGRLAMLGALPMAVTAVIDSLFLVALLLIMGREIVVGRKWKDLKVVGALSAVTFANLAFHAVALTGGDIAIAARVAVSGYVVMVMIIGGRIVPSFTRNWLNQRGEKRFPAPHDRFDMGVTAFGALTLALWSVWPEARLTLVAAVVAGILHAARLARWRGLATWPEKLLFVLHASYALVPAAFLAVAASGLGVVTPASALHVFTVGVIGCMMLSVMTRATRGHTGRPLTASPMTIAAYLCLFAAALARPLADLSDDMALMEVAGLLWIVAFGLFLWEYAPMLLRERRTPRGH